MNFLIISIISSFISANKIEKSGDFVKSDEILRDVLFGGRKSNITSETRLVDWLVFLRKFSIKMFENFHLELYVIRFMRLKTHS